MEFHLIDMLYRCGMEFGHKEIRRFGITETECRIGSYVYAHPGCSQDEAVRATRIDKTTVAKAMRTLEEKGLIGREPNRDDRRSKKLSLTEEGRARISAVYDLHDRWLKTVLNCLNPDEQAQFEAYCHRLYRAAETLLTESNPKQGE